LQDLGLDGFPGLLERQARYPDTAVGQAKVHPAIGIDAKTAGNGLGWQGNTRLDEQDIKEALYGRYHACFADFKAAIEEVIGQMPSKYKGRLASLLTFSTTKVLRVFVPAASIRAASPPS
jgi:hypothetical protein